MKKHALKDWLLATRPWSFPASVMPVAVTVVWLWSQGVAVNWWLGLWAVVNIVFVHAAGNVWSDIADYRRGVDAADTFGVRLLVDNVFRVDEFRRLSLVLNLVAIGGGLALVALTGPTLLAIGLAGMALSLLYPRLKYLALGDLVIICCYALLPMAGTSFIVAGQIHWDVLWLAVPVGLITVAILHVNNVRDIETDSRAGILTFPLLTGRRFGVFLYVFEVLFPFLWLAVVIGCRVAAWPLALACLALPLAWKNARILLAYEQNGKSSYATLDEGTAQLQLLFSVLLMAGMALSVFLV